MIVSARFLPTTSSRVHPNVASACAFHATIVPVESMPTKASCAVSTISRARASLSASRASAVRRSSSAMATTIEVADRDREVLLVDGPACARSPTCSAQSTPTVVLSCRSGTSSMAPMPLGDEIAVAELARARIGLRVVGRDDALALDGVEVGRERRWRCSGDPDSYRLAGAAVQADAADQRALVVELATCSAARPPGVGGDLEDAPQPFVELVAGIGVSGGELGQRIALRHQPALAGLERRFGGELLADVVEDGEDGGLALPRDEAGRREHPERLAVLALDLQPQVVGSTVAPEPVGQLNPLRGVDVVVADRQPDRRRRSGMPMISDVRALMARTVWS